MISSTIKGQLCELLVRSWAMSKGYTVSVPTDPGSKYDLLVERNGKQEKWQVKLAFWQHKPSERKRNASGGWVLGRCGSRSVRAGQRILYTADSFDFLAAVCTNRALYLINYSELPASFVNGASSYRIEQKIKPITNDCGAVNLNGEENDSQPAS
jgi:PD-(D/E)XK nuclease superfamily protein